MLHSSIKSYMCCLADSLTYLFCYSVTCYYAFVLASSQVFSRIVSLYLTANNQYSNSVIFPVFLDSQN